MPPVAADDAGWDSIWTWDHLMAIFGPWEQPIFEGWSVLCRRSVPSRRRVRLGLMVGANTIRNPGLTAKLATTLDHVSGGRAVLGIGGAWFEREHDAYGIEFGAGFGERLDRLDESVMLMRRLLDGERFSHEGPLLPLPRRALRAAAGPAAPADPRRRLRAEEDAPDRGRTGRRLEHLGHGRGGPDRSSRSSRPLRATSAATSRRSRRRSASRSSSATTRQRPGPRSVPCSTTTARRTWAPDRSSSGSPTSVADAIRPYRELGFETVIVRMPAPYDPETIERMAEVAGATGGVRVVALAGGTGGAKLAHGLQLALGPGDLTVIVNTGDDSNVTASS